MAPHWRAPAGMHVAAPALPVEGDLPSLDGATGWLNSERLTPAGLRGQVTLVGFWTYTCVNWLRQLPYLRAWAAKYAAQGLVLIGAHTPEFSFEHNPDNVRRAVEELAITYPVAIDSNAAVWRDFGNHYWPALYFADAQGRIRHHHFGEGAYGQSEMVIQQLLAEAGHDGPRDLVSVTARGLEAPADWASLRSAENYTGYERTENFVSPGGPARDRPHAYAVPAQLALSQWALSGEWTMAAEATTLNAPNGQIACRFHARDLNLVMGPADPATPVRFGVLLDGRPPGDDHGADVDRDGNGTLQGQRTYQLIRQSGRPADRTFTISFRDPRAQAYCFTFG